MATSPESVSVQGKPSPAAMEKTTTTKKAPVATDDGAGGRETTAATDVLAVISRLVGRPFLDETASNRLEKLGKMLATEAVLETLLHDADRRLLGSLAADLREAEAALDDVEDRHLRLQGLIVAHKGERRNLVRKLLLELKCSRMKNKLERRLSKAEGIVNKAHRQVKSIMDTDRQKRSLVPVSSASSKMAK